MNMKYPYLGRATYKPVWLLWLLWSYRSKLCFFLLTCWRYGIHRQRYQQLTPVCRQTSVSAYDCEDE